MIYNRYGAPVRLLTSRGREVESPRNGEMFEVWFCVAELTGPYPDGSGKVGEKLFDGQEFQAGQELRADGGWGEIEDACLLVEDMTMAKNLLRGLRGEMEKHL